MIRHLAEFASQCGLISESSLEFLFFDGVHMSNLQKSQTYVPSQGEFSALFGIIFPTSFEPIIYIIAVTKRIYFKRLFNGRR